MNFNADRRGALLSFCAGLMVSGLAQSGPVNAAAEPTLEPPSAKDLRQLSRVLAGIPRRRDFKVVPIILDKPDPRDAAPLAAVLAYKAGPNQALRNPDIARPWLD